MDPTLQNIDPNVDFIYNLTMGEFIQETEN